MTSLSIRDSIVEKSCPPRVVPTRFALPIAGARFLVTVLSAVSLAFVVNAIDRSLTTFEYFYEEVLMIAAPCFIFIVIQAHLVVEAAFGQGTHRKLFLALGTLAVAFLLASWIVSAVRIGQGAGACTGPAMMGVYDNLRDCRRLQSGTIVAVINSLAASIMVGLELVQG